jgi:leucine-rich repeat transmembrane neuronal protein 1/2
MSRNGTKSIKQNGNLPHMCQEVEAADPVTFTTRDSFLELPNWDSARAGTLSLKIRTNEPNGVLVYNSGANNGVGQSSDFLAFELLDGHIYLLLNLGSGSVKVKATTRRVDDGHWHTVSLRRTGRSGRVTVDESAVDFISPGTSNQLDLEGPLFLGGVGTQSTESTKMSHILPAELWSGSLKYGFVGCVRDLVVNGDAIDIAEFARRQDSGSIRPACHTSPPQCDSQPCMNSGSCIEGWNRFTCDCSLTSFTGPVCAKGIINYVIYIAILIKSSPNNQQYYDK